MANKIKLKRTYTAPRSAYIANISVSDEIPTRANINSMNQAYSDARQQVNNVMAQYELDKRKSLLQDSISRNIANEKILSIGAGQRPIDTQRLNNLIFNRTEHKAGGSVGRKRYAVGGNLSNRINRRNYWFDENDGVIEYDNSPDSTPTETVTNTNQTASNALKSQSKQTNQNTSNDSNSIVTIGTKSFGSAFRQARVAGLDVFRWRGKVYNTKLASEVKNDTKRSSKSNRTKTTSRQTTPRQSRQQSNQLHIGSNGNQLNIGSTGIVTVPVFPDNDRSSQTRTAPTTSNKRQYNARASFSNPVIYDIARTAGNIRGNLTSNKYNASFAKPAIYDVAREVGNRKGTLKNNSLRASFGRPVIYDIARETNKRRRK